MKALERISPDVVHTERTATRVGPPAYPEWKPETPALPLSQYLWILRRHMWPVLGFVVLVVASTWGVSVRLQRMYEATAKIDVDRRAPSGVIGQEASQSSPVNDSDQFLATQIELIQSDAVLRPVARKYNLLHRENQLEKLTADKVEDKSNAPILLRNLKITRPANTYVLRITYRSADPKVAADVANAIAQSYLEHTFNIRIRSSSALSSFMERQLEELRAKMEQSSLALAQFERELNVMNPEEKTGILSARLLQLNTEYTKAQAERVRKESSWNAARTGSLEAAQVSTQGEALGRLSDRLNDAQQRFVEVSTIFGANHSEHRKAANQLAEVRRQFDATKNNITQRIETDYQQSLAREQMLAKSVADTKAEYDALNARSFEYQQVKREADADKRLYEDLVRRIKEAGINAGFQNSAIRIADLARPPAEPVSPNIPINMLLALFVSALVGVIAAIVADMLDNTLRDPEQVRRTINADVIGTLPAVKQLIHLPGQARLAAASSASTTVIDVEAEPASRGRKRRVSKGYGGISSYEEAIRSLRNSIVLSDFDRNLKSLLVTSAAPGEGKSTAVLHLAIAHAEQGKRTLVIDSDLRRPTIHKKLGMEQGRGLSNVLLGEMHWKEAVIELEERPNLHILCSGPASRRASDVVGPMMIDILDEAGREYDLIFVDAPPLLGFAESLQVAKATDGAIVITRAGRTNRRAVASVVATLHRLRANVLGLVLNHVKSSTANGYYYEYHEHYGKYYGNREASEIES